MRRTKLQLWGEVHETKVLSVVTAFAMEFVFVPMAPVGAMADGKGYPDGLAGEEIPLEARIICVADCYDAMTSDRVYRDHLPQDVVRQEIVKGMGAQFDPTVAEAMLDIIDEDEDYLLRE